MKTNLSERLGELNSEEFVVGDMMVIQNHILGPLGSDSIFCIIEIRSDFLDDHISMTDIDGKVWTSGLQYICHATVAENQLKRRLTVEELGQAEVS